MQRVERILIFGASARAAAFSALRAGLSPWCADLFADTDLLGACPAMRLPGKYPAGFRDLIDCDGEGPWMYTGALENHPDLVGDLASRRELWGNGKRVLLRCRRPEFLADVALRAGLRAPEVIAPHERHQNQSGWTPLSPDVVNGLPGRWLAKPLAGSAGFGVRFWQGEWLLPDWPAYLQEYIEGVPVSAVYVGSAHSPQLLGVTRQLIGELWLNARPFAYCGNVAPWPVPDATLAGLRRLGNLLCDEGGLRGLFGVDGVLREGEFYPVEINPRYTASVEVIEHATGVKAMELHRQAFGERRGVIAPCLGERRGGSPPCLGRAGDVSPLSGAHDASETHSGGSRTPLATDQHTGALTPRRSPSETVVGKAILYAPADGVFPVNGPWPGAFATSTVDIPAFADIPRAGEPLESGGPVLTMLVSASTVEDCLAQLRERAAEVNAWLGWPLTPIMTDKGAGS